MPSAGLTPDRQSDNAACPRQFAHIALAVPANEGWILSSAFVFAAGLQFDDFLEIESEEMPVERKVAKEVALAILHRKDEMARLDASQGAGKAAAVPNQVAYEIGADSPCPKHEPPISCLENGKQNPKHLVDLARRAQDQTAAERVLDVVSVGLADAQYDPLNFGKIVQARRDDLLEPRGGSRGSPAQTAIHGRRSRYEIRSEIDAEFVIPENREERAKFLTKDSVAGADLRLEPRVIGKMRDVVERNSIVAKRSGFARKGLKVRADRAPLRLVFRTGSAEVVEWNLRPVDTPLVIAPKKWANRIDEREFHINQRRTQALHPLTRCQCDDRMKSKTVTVLKQIRSQSPLLGAYGSPREPRRPRRGIHETRRGRRGLIMCF